MQSFNIMYLLSNPPFSFVGGEGGEGQKNGRREVPVLLYVISFRGVGPKRKSTCKS